MSGLEESEKINRLIERIDQLLNVIKMVADDLSEVSDSLKKLASVKTSTGEGESPFQSIQNAFSEDLRNMLDFEDLGDYVRISPKRYLGSDNFARIASVVRSLGGEYISAGKESHFRVPKRG
ncbi:hypothetical protein J7L06_09970 [Candidatus Bathyarchaeota archaeon]|nr:hypothetical protein [Candidatus Bathyarchaeota archaeon]